MSTDIPTLMGPWLVGGMVASMLCGMVIIQSYSYFVAYPKDKLYLKLLVAYFLLFSIANFGVDVAVLWHYLITGKNNAKVFDSSPRSQDLQLISPTLIAFAAQSFFAHRSWILTGKRMVLAIVFAIMILFSFSSGIAAFVQAKIAGETYTNPDRTAHEVALLSKILDIWLFGTATTDVFISIILSITLSKERRGFSQRTDDILGKLLRIALTTASVTSVFAVVDAVVLVTTVPKGSNAHLAFFLQLPHLYPLCVIYTLNVRNRIAEVMGGSMGSSGTDSAKAHNKPTFRTVQSNSRPAAPEAATGIKVTVNTLQRLDDFDDDSTNVREKGDFYQMA